MGHALNGHSKEEIKQLVTQTYKYDLSANCDYIRANNSFNETCQVTVPQTIIAFLESSDFENAIRLAISIGGDSDTIAAITGGIAEAFYGIPVDIQKRGLKYLPNEFIDALSNLKKQSNERL